MNDPTAIGLVVAILMVLGGFIAHTLITHYWNRRDEYLFNRQKFRKEEMRLNSELNNRRES
jgi:hypothetical protein